MGQPSQKTEFTDEERAIGVDENGGELTAEQRKNPVGPVDPVTPKTPPVAPKASEEV